MNFHEDKFPQMENAVALFCLTFFHYNITEVFSTGAAVQYHSWCENCMGLFWPFLQISGENSVLVKSQCVSFIHPCIQCSVSRQTSVPICQWKHSAVSGLLIGSLCPLCPSCLSCWGLRRFTQNRNYSNCSFVFIVVECGLSPFLTENLAANLFSSTLPEIEIDDLEPALKQHFARGGMLYVHLPTSSICGAGWSEKEWHGDTGVSEGNK